jgi:DNA transposition AAA+ family ATPase
MDMDKVDMNGPARTAAKAFNASLRDALEAWMERNELTLSEAARQLGTNATQVSKYRSGKPEGDVDRLEGLIADALKNESRRREASHELFATAISRQLAGVLETIRETNDFALISGDAGIGKSAGIDLYVRDNPTTVAVTVKVWCRNPGDVEGLIFHALANQGWRRDRKRADFLVGKLKGSNRLVIVDNAHRLTELGLAWLFDFHDATGCPIALVGNPEILERIRRNDQMFSRIGTFSPLKLVRNQAREIARRIVQQLAPSAGDELDDLVEAIGQEQGHFRAVRKEVLLARKVRENGKAKDGQLSWATALQAAHTQLVRGYAL